MKKVLLLGSIFCFLGAECMTDNNIDNYEYTQNKVSRNAVMGIIPSNSSDAKGYAELYNHDKDDSISLQAGILAVKYYIDHKEYAEAADLLASILPAIVCEEDFLSFFNSLIAKSAVLIKICCYSNLSKENIEKALSD